MITCKDCAYFQPQDDFGGDCYLNPPTVVPVVFQRGEAEEHTEAINYRPRVSHNEYCQYRTRRIDE